MSRSVYSWESCRIGAASGDNSVRAAEYSNQKHLDLATGRKQMPVLLQINSNQPAMGG
jgi:hypothetical protein